MTITVTVYEAEIQLSRLLTKVEAGEEVIIAEAGKPRAKLIRFPEPEARRPGIAKGAVTDAFFEPLGEAELSGWG